VFELTTLLIPGYNGQRRGIGPDERYGSRRAGTERAAALHRFHPDYKMTDIPATPAGKLTRRGRSRSPPVCWHVYTGSVA